MTARIRWVKPNQIPVGSGADCPAPSGQNGSYRPGKPLLDQRANLNSRLRWV